MADDAGEHRIVRPAIVKARIITDLNCYQVAIIFAVYAMDASPKPSCLSLSRDLLLLRVRKV